LVHEDPLEPPAPWVETNGSPAPARVSPRVPMDSGHLRGIAPGRTGRSRRAPCTFSAQFAVSKKRRPRTDTISRVVPRPSKSGRQDLNLRPLGPEPRHSPSHRFHRVANSRNPLILLPLTRPPHRIQSIRKHRDSAAGLRADCGLSPARRFRHPSPRSSSRPAPSQPSAPSATGTGVPR
jgi:hypothetical protein